jgi:glycosyltransferase involved in cell wall biosynthesis
MNEPLPLVSVFCPTYNHDKYISQCLDGIVMQKRNFAIEVIVQDDASTDNTAKIIKKYASKYNYIIPNIHKENQYTNGKNLNEYFFKNAKGKYVAFCEGDDYWTDPYKLQKQIDFLEANDDFSICFHNTKEQYVNSEKPTFLYCEKNQKEISTIEDLLQKSNFIPTCSVIFRNKLFKHFPNWFNDLGMGDWIIHILNAEHGKIKYLDSVMGVHRLHETGVWTNEKNINKLLQVYEAYLKLGEYFQNKFTYKAIIKNKKAQFLYLIHLEYHTIKDKWSALKYFIMFLLAAPTESFKIKNIKRLIKLCIV